MSTPGGLNQSAMGAARARQKLLTRRHGLRLESKQLLPTQLPAKIRTLLMKSNTMLQGSTELKNIADSSLPMRPRNSRNWSKHSLSSSVLADRTASFLTGKAVS